MNRTAVGLTMALFSAALVSLAVACGGYDNPAGSPSTPTQDQQHPRPGDLESTVKSERVTEAAFPVAMALTPDGRLFYNELLEGNVRVVDHDGRLLPEPFAHVDVRTGGEYGLLGIAIDPEFESNHYVYVYFTAPSGEELARPTIMRFTDVDNVGDDPTVILELPETYPDEFLFHVAGNIHFGPDGYLYVSVGDYHRPELSQDLSVPQGKILRINKEDGSAAPDNPFVEEPDADPRVFAYGLRNAFDFAFHPLTGQIYATENGDGNCDELDVIIPGGNYGWPGSNDLAPLDGSGTCHSPDGIDPIFYFTRHPSIRPATINSPVAPTGIEFVSWHVYKNLEASLLVCEYNTGLMRHFLLEGGTLDVVADGSVVVRDCALDIAIAPGGVAYYSNPVEIRRLVPSE